jgi:hypothetical protein
VALTNAVAAVAVLALAVFFVARGRSLAREEANLFAGGSKGWENIRAVGYFGGALLLAGVAVGLLITGTG